MTTFTNIVSKDVLRGVQLKTMEILKDNSENPSVIGTVTDNEGIVIE